MRIEGEADDGGLVAGDKKVVVILVSDEVKVEAEDSLTHLESLLQDKLARFMEIGVEVDIVGSRGSS